LRNASSDQSVKEIERWTYLSPDSASRHAAHHAASASQLSTHDDLQLIISAALRILDMCGASSTSTVVSGTGTTLRKLTSTGTGSVGDWPGAGTACVAIDWQEFSG
jgi:hypothetical protein